MTASAGQTGVNGPGARLSVTLAALALLALMGWLLVSGALGDSVTYDEQPHVAAGYTYLTRRTIDFNVEHPPLLKDLSALPLLFMPLDLSWERDEIAAGKTPDWPTGDPWEFGRKLLDHSGVDPELTMFAARAPMIAVTLLLGWAVFAFARRRYGAVAGLIALVLYVLSPTILAHGRLVTTDVGAAAGFFIALAAFLRFLENPRARNVLLAGLALGAALLAKFSTFLLVPVFVLLGALWMWLQRKPGGDGSEAPGAVAEKPRRPWGSPLRWRRGTLLLAMPRLRLCRRPTVPRADGLARVSAARIAAVLLIGFAVVYLVYAHHIHNLPIERQIARAKFSLAARGVGNTPKDIAMWMTERPAWRPLGQYFSGMIQTMTRSAQGGGVYLLGTFHPQGVREYFPLVYLMKEPAALHVLTLLALLSALTGLLLRWGLPAAMRTKWRTVLREEFATLAVLLVLVAYWLVSIRSNLNIGVRHIIPVLPLTFVLVARELRALAVRLPLAMNFREGFALHTGLVLMGYFAFVGGLLLWQAMSVLRVQPFQMAYFNEFAGGPENGWQRVIDSNADWGQDMGRLARFVNEHHIDKLALDYFGSSDANRYLPGKWEAINACMPPRKGWVAVSTMFYQNSAATPACDYRRWLPLGKLTAKVGYSMLVFHVE